MTNVFNDSSHDVGKLAAAVMRRLVTTKEMRFWDENGSGQLHFYVEMKGGTWMEGSLPKEWWSQYEIAPNLFSHSFADDVTRRILWMRRN